MEFVMSDDTKALLKRIFTHQMQLGEEIQQRLHGTMPQALEEAFKENKAMLKGLLESDDVSSEKLNRLQDLWKSLSAQLEDFTASVSKQSAPTASPKTPAQTF